MCIFLSLTRKTRPKVPVPKVGESEVSNGGRNLEEMMSK